MSDRAIYYPYTHMRDDNWLKATLLLFSEVRRMLPMNFTPEDSPFVRECAQDVHYEKSGWFPPLVRPAPLGTDLSIKTQIAIADKLQRDSQDPDFMGRFGFYSQEVQQCLPTSGFQIHQKKLDKYLLKVLYEKELAWDPLYPEPYDHGGEYLQIHPCVGEVVMSALAIACAHEDGLDIVGDSRSGRLHAALMQKDIEAVYDAWLRPSAFPEKPPEVTGKNVFEFLLGFRCDLSKVTRQSLATMKENREPLQILIRKLNDMATDKEIPAMEPGPRQQEYFRDATSQIIREWESNRANLSHFWRVFFGEGIADPGVKFFEKVAEKVIEGAAIGATGAASTGATHGTLVATISGAAGSLGIGLVTHARKSYKKMKNEAENSPYHYLTLLEENAGVVFRTAPGRS